MSIPSTNKKSLTADLKAGARRIGFDLVGIAPAVAPIGFHDLIDWLDRGYAGEMSYLERRRNAYEHPRHVLDVVRSVVMLGVNYHAGDAFDSTSPDREGGILRRSESEAGPSLTVGASRSAARSSHDMALGRVARYAQAPTDYHDVLRERLKQLGNWLHERVPGCRTRGVVDTAPLLERDFARLAGLGWFGKNTMLINKRIGSWTFLAGLLTDVELEPDAPHEASHCGTCTRCLDACPTDAFPEPHVLDASRCISYLTIELRDQLPPAELREGIGDWLFGCDVCQDVCPWNRKAPATSDPAFTPSITGGWGPTTEAPSGSPREHATTADDWGRTVGDANPKGDDAGRRLDPSHPSVGPHLDPVELLAMGEAEFRERFRHTPLSRPKRAGLLRNACLVLGNSGDASAARPLARALADPDPLVREAAAWALQQLGGDSDGERREPDSVPREESPQ